MQPLDADRTLTRVCYRGLVNNPNEVFNSPSPLRAFVQLALITCVVACSKPPDPLPEVTPSVKAFEVGRLATGQARRVSGKVKAQDRSTLSFGVGGKVDEIPTSEGDMVVAGQLLARLDGKSLGADVEKARAQLSTARAALLESESQFDRTRALVEGRAAAARDLEEATAALAKARGDVDAARAALDQLERDLARTHLVAPFDGQVLSVSIAEFEDVGSTQEAVVLLASGALKVDVLVPETLVRDVEYGQAVVVDFPTLPDVSLGGTITSIGAETGVGNAFEVTVTLAEQRPDLRPGMTATVQFNFSAYLDGRSAFLVPISALAIEQGVTANASSTSTERRAPLFLLDETAGVVRRREVLIGDLRGNDIEVFEGLAAGDLVVTAGVSFLRDGMAARSWTP